MLGYGKEFGEQRKFEGLFLLNWVTGSDGMWRLQPSSPSTPALARLAPRPLTAAAAYTIDTDTAISVKT